MSSSNPSLGWERLQNVFYRSRECLELQWKQEEIEEGLNLQDYKVAIAPYAASIALYSIRSIPELAVNKSIHIYSGAGVKITSISWLSSIGEIVELGWNSKFQLIVVMKSGKFRIYNNYEGDFDEFDLHLESDIIEVKFWPDGFVARSIDDSFTCISNYSKVIPICLPSITTKNDESKKRQIHGWAILPPMYNRQVKVIVSTDISVLIISLDGVTDTNFVGNGPFTSIAIASNGEFVALYSTSSNEISIRTADFSVSLTTFESDNDSIPLELQWCSNDAVIVSYTDELKLIGPSRDSLSFYTDSVTYLKPEDDGLYFLNNERLEFLSRVSNVTMDTFKIGSTSPSAILLDAIDQIDHHSPKANENLEIIKGDLTTAVDNCIRAAAEEFEPYWQKKLLRAASFGKTTIDLYNSDEFVDTCNNLRVLNIIRQPEVGIFLTYSQFIELGVDRLIKLLLLRQLHYLCVKISDFMTLPTDEIFIDWACCKIKHSLDLSDTELLSAIIKRLLDKNVSFAPISQLAYQEGRTQLSINLLNFEKDTSKTIPLLLEMEQDDYALLKSDENMNVDSIMFVLITLFNKLSLSDFFKLLDGKPNATSLFKSKIAQNDIQLLHDYYFQADLTSGLAEIELDKLANEKSSEIQKQILMKGSKILGRSKYTEFESKRLKDEIKIIDAKIKLEQEIPSIKNTESAAQILEEVITQDLKKAIKVHKELKISERQFYYKVAKTLSKLPERRQELHEFATSKKSPIGYEPFYLELLKNGDKRQASLYVNLCTSMDYRQKVKCYIKCEDFKNAIEEAYKRKDVELLDLIRSLTDNSVHKRHVDDCIERLTGSRR
ncbi:hypothetical protein CANARDRAFT_26436 [[Candida] arabinofermentans NRRL YB-2248]|uniref:Probable vacuolar protein sorting-associated protein 16 homolog n=1 Tax=[Candida] arabinofermentans NRRL YB-2248 TaxID=983967 RepID=A0A1E4T927_9ASCO|nr:hypothetical protein CANARDRAFT_26436 [[Candida] arabinofermentans NRRL YB-2248]